MANIRVRARLDKITNELEAIWKHIHNYSGINRKDAERIDNIGAYLEDYGKALQKATRDPSIVND